MYIAELKMSYRRNSSEIALAIFVLQLTINEPIIFSRKQQCILGLCNAQKYITTYPSAYKNDWLICT